MIPPHLFYQIYLSFLEQNDCTPPRCGELSDYTDSAHTQVEEPSLGCINVSNVYDRCGDVPASCDVKLGDTKVSL